VVVVAVVAVVEVVWTATAAACEQMTLISGIKSFFTDMVSCDIIYALLYFTLVSIQYAHTSRSFVRCLDATSDGESEQGHFSSKPRLLLWA
jgi:hypothetical protein